MISLRDSGVELACGFPGVCWTRDTVVLCARTVKEMTSSTQLPIFFLKLVVVRLNWNCLTGSEVTGMHTEHNCTSHISLGNQA